MDGAQEIVYIDVDEGLGRLRGNKTIYRKMLGMFLQSKEFGILEEDLAQNDLAKAGDTAHAIKGMTGNLSLKALFEISAKLMQELRDGLADAETIRLYRETLTETCKKVDAFCLEFDKEQQ